MPEVLARIRAGGAYVPRLRLPRARIQEAMGWLAPPTNRGGRGARAICNWDEDALTLAVEAARDCLQPPEVVAGRPVATVILASTTLPFSDRSNATLLAAALDLPTAVATLDVTGTLRCGVAALVQAARNTVDETLVVAADARLARPGSLQEQDFGAAAVAYLVEPGRRDSRGECAGGPVLAEVLATAHRAADFVDHYRMSGEAFDYALEERWVRDAGLSKLVPEAIAAALQAAGLTPDQIQHAVLPGSSTASQRLAQVAGLSGSQLQDSLRADCGDSGAAHPLLMLAAVLEVAAPGQNILLASFGQGVDAVVLRVPERHGHERSELSPRPLVSSALQRRFEETSYTRYLAHRGLLLADFGMRAERDNRSAHSTAWRKNRQITGFIGGRCAQCSTVQYPLSRVCVNPDCRRADTQEQFRLAETHGRVKSFTEDWQAYSPRPPAIYGNVEFEPGGNLLMDFTDLEAGELHVGDRVRFVFRIKDIDRARGFRRYFWKATPATSPRT
ncbi:MAG: OB-fold domain-containing protein [Sinobacteraceae bacterium]|nr:OB-fold domain-containing protein [Nevskiaceae bacterium]